MVSRRLKIVGASVVACAIGLGLLLPSVIGGWAPVLHWNCEVLGEVGAGTVQIPGLLLNSPFEGKAWGNVTYASGFIPDNLVGEGTQDSDGGAAWAGFESNVTVFSVGNETHWGPGTNTDCGSAREVQLTPIGNPSLGIPIMGPGNVSDANEPTELFPSAGASFDQITFSNGFTHENSPSVSTCNGGAQSLVAASSYLDLWIHLGSSAENVTVAFELPVVGIAFHYWFPPDTGVWQVDSLSAPGGPGGGWAFSYSPCP